MARGREKAIEQPAPVSDLARLSVQFDEGMVQAIGASKQIHDAAVLPPQTVALSENDRRTLGAACIELAVLRAQVLEIFGKAR